MGMLPGMGQMLKEVDLDDSHFKRVEAIVLSMTVAERRNPELIDMERRRRIAAGSGNPVQAVHDMLKQFKMMQGLMRKLGKGGAMPELPGMPGIGLPGVPGPDALSPRKGRGSPQGGLGPGLGDFLNQRRKGR
jgi:signal recognition particle subunit SRP54